MSKTFKNIIDEAFTPEFEKWVSTKIQTATNEKNQLDLANLQALQKEIAAMKTADLAKQQQQQVQQKPQPQVQQQAQTATAPQTQTATTAQ